MSENIRGILALGHCWLGTIGKEIAPKIPRALPPEETLVSIGGDVTLVKAVVNPELANVTIHTSGLMRFSFSRPMVECVPALEAQVGQLW